MNEQSFEESVARICETNTQYNIEAYYFLREALEYSVKLHNRTDENRHVTGQELSEAIREYALNEYGPLTHLVLTEWGLKKTDDFGEMVYILINAGVFGKSKEDRKEDFNDVFDFKEAFLDPFEPMGELPQNVKPNTKPPTKATPKKKTSANSKKSPSKRKKTEE